MAAPVPTPVVNEWLDDYPAAPAAKPPTAPAPVAPINAGTVTAGKVTTTNATGTNWTVNPNQTVQSQVKGIIAADSPLMQQAATRAKQQMNGRGLLNSSMAIGAGQDAVIGAAMPMAQQDAQTFASAGKYNADVANSMSTFNAGAKNAASTQNAQLGLEAGKANQSASLEAARANQATALARSQQVYDGGLKIAMQNADAAGKLQLQKLDADTRGQIAAIEAKWRQGMQTSASMAQTFQSMTDNIARIMADQEMDGPAKQAAINNLTTLYDNALKSQEAISGLELGNLLAFDTPTAPAPAPKPPPAPPSGGSPNYGDGGYYGSDGA